MPILVCEGQCSQGAVQTFDRALSEERKAYLSTDVRVFVTAEMKQARERFVYTEHRQSSALATCNVCGCVRRFGDPLI